MEIQLWEELLSPYEQAVDELVLKFNHMIKQFKERETYSVIEQVDGRVKEISGILEKARKKNIPAGSIKENLKEITDIAGIRIICQFVEDIYSVVGLIENRSDMTIKTRKDYVNNMKESGYRSYHLIVSYKVETIKGTVEIPVEIQIRTMAMNFWATIEHSLQYKYQKNIPQHIRKRLNSVSESIIKLDNEMSSIHSEMMAAQDCYINNHEYEKTFGLKDEGLRI